MRPLTPCSENGTKGYHVYKVTQHHHHHHHHHHHQNGYEQKIRKAEPNRSSNNRAQGYNHRLYSSGRKITCTTLKLHQHGKADLQQHK